MRLELSSGPFQNFTDQITSMVDDMLGRQYVRFCSTDAWRPHVNVYETPAAFIVCVDLAGMKPDEIDVEAQGNKLQIRGRRQPPVPSDAPANETRVHLMEIDGGPFSREIDIYRPIQQTKIAASYRDGLLWISIPKAD